MASRKVIQAVLADVARDLAQKYRTELRRMKRSRSRLRRDDFVWHELLLSFSTMGNSRGVELIRKQEFYGQVSFDALRKLSQRQRARVLNRVLRKAKVRMPTIKSAWLLKNFRAVSNLGGPTAAKTALLTSPKSSGKIEFLKKFAGIGDKYARNIMMDVYHPDFRNCIAVDRRIKSLSKALGLTFGSYDDEEQFYKEVAHLAGIEGWELDRLIYRFTPEFKHNALEDLDDIRAAARARKEPGSIPWETVKRKLNL